MPTPPPHVVVLDDWEAASVLAPQWQSLRARIHLDVHQQPLHGDALVQAVAEAHALVLNRDRTPITAELVARMPRLERIVHTAARNLKIDRAATDARGIRVSGTIAGPGHESTCEQAWAMILGARRRLVEQANGLRIGRWREGDAASLPTLLHGARLGVIGLGHIGKRVAQVGAAFGMEVVAWSPHMTPERAAEVGAHAVGLEELMATSDVVSLHLVASEHTIGLVDAPLLARMKPDAVLVNTSRAALVVKEDLVRALRAGRPGYAALDVFETEPLPPDDPLLTLPNVLLTPHMGFISREAMATFSVATAEAIAEWLEQRA
jgi:phosphoglycerate dehydrogenase-like enzyme